MSSKEPEFRDVGDRERLRDKEPDWFKELRHGERSERHEPQDKDSENGTDE